MKEQEIWGELTKKQYIGCKKTFNRRFGKPQRYKRLAIQFWDRSVDRNTATRIRITNGVPQIMQKYGHWEKKDVLKFTETSIDLPPDVGQVFAAYKILKNLTLKTTDIMVIQHENEIYDCDDYEIKLARQFGRSARFIFEVEIKDNKKNLTGIIADLGLSQYAKTTDTDFWDKWNQDVNLSVKDLGDPGVRKIIESYL